MDLFNSENGFRLYNYNKNAEKYCLPAEALAKAWIFA